MIPSADASLLALLIDADPVVKAVMLVLVLASVASWGLAFETLRRQLVLRRLLSRPGSPAVDALVAEGERAARLAIPHETGGEYRARIERVIGEGGMSLVRRTDAGLPVLATIASVSPFVGLFGTVWGVMNSFSAVASANDTSLATVAPGIAEALFTTALGLFASVPALIAYNRLGTSARRIGRMTDALAGSEAVRIAACPGATRPYRAAAE
jgi:biopolymer transport protein ExbB/TolQ